MKTCRHLTSEEPAPIEILHKEGYEVRAIAQRLGRAGSGTHTRERLKTVLLTASNLQGAPLQGMSEMVPVGHEAGCVPAEEMPDYYQRPGIQAVCFERN